MKLIDADALDAEMYHKSFEVDDGRNVWNSGLWIRYKIYEEAIRDATTIDAVPVIRCKDCKHWQKSVINYNEYVCYWGGYVKQEDDFCSWGEKEKKDNG